MRTIRVFAAGFAFAVAVSPLVAQSSARSPRSAGEARTSGIDSVINRGARAYRNVTSTRAAFEQRAHLAQVQERPKRRLPGVRAQPLVGGGDADGLFARVELDCLSHRLVSRSRVVSQWLVLHTTTTPRR